MSAFIDKVASAVVERLQHMTLKARRRSPRPYLKRLKASSRDIPTVVLPTGPMPDEPWCEAEEPDEDGMYRPRDAEYVPLIGEAILQYHKEHAHRTKITAYHADKSIADFLTVNRLHENEPIYLITREHCKQWRAVLLARQHAGPSQARNKRVANAGTIDRKLKAVSHFFAWCVSQEFISTNPLVGLNLPKRLVAAAKVKKTAFTLEELAVIQAALLALPAHDHPRTEFKWCALALLFSGARCQEMLQLRHSDIRQLDGIWCFDIKPDASMGNRVKNHPSIRLVPIHSQLIQLGFLEWVTAQKTGTASERVFPLIHPKGSPLVSMWFSRILTSLGLKRPEVSLHSLRHTVTVLLARQKTYPPLQNKLLGHATGQNVEQRVYLAGLTYTISELSAALEAVRFPAAGAVLAEERDQSC